MPGPAETVGVVLEELGGLAETVGALLGRSTAGAVAQVASLIFMDGARVAHVVSAVELEAVRLSRQTGIGAGLAAYTESHQNFARRCVACDATLKACNIAKATSEGGKCCPDCSHPAP